MRLEFLSGPTYLHNETFYNVKEIELINLGRSFNRIEYETLLNGDSSKATRIQNWYLANSTDSSLFRTGK